MSPKPSIELLDNIFNRYHKASPAGKSVILNEFCANHNCHRKSAIRIFGRAKKPETKRNLFIRLGRPSPYRDKILLNVIELIWVKTYYPCSRNLKACLKVWLPAYEKTFGVLPEKIRKLLLSISPATIDRIFKPTRSRYKRRGRSTTKPGTLLKNRIPVKTDQWNERKPGFIEADTVAHCGDSVAGAYVNTLDMLDIATQWSQQRAVWGKGEPAVFEQIKDIEKSLPFRILGFDSDNGSEFINYHLWRYFVSRRLPVQFTRGREYKKNDSAHIEQKNWTHVRQWLGYARFDKPQLVPLLNDLYKNEWSFYHNFFHPSVKLIDKKRIGSKTIKHHDAPKTPYQRIMESPYVVCEVKERLTKTFESLNPFELHQAMMAKIKKIRSLL